ncbi:MAG TPA: hypothetical protein VFI21_13530 [Nocardioides sp.]|nr:hypothetical protein [Nocardioides sp.]
MTDNPSEVLDRGPQTLAEMAELSGERGHHDNPRRWDRLVDQWLADCRVLAETDEGRGAIAALLVDPRPTVRLWSAAAVLFWDADAARPVLAEIRDQPLTYDLHSITAKHTLIEFDAGTLDRDARLPGS